MNRLVASQAPPTVSSAARRAGLFVALTWAQALALALIFPNSEMAPLLAIVTPTIAAVLVITFATPQPERRAAWAGVGFRRPTWQSLAIALIAPAAITFLSFSAAAAIGVARFPPANLTLQTGLRFLIQIAIFAVIFLGEEIGWRGYLFPRLKEIMSGRRSSLLTGACHAIFHLPLLLLTTTYQSAGNRGIVVPMVMGTLTLAGVVYGWLRAWGGTIWPVALAHSAFNLFMEAAAEDAVTSSPEALAYFTTETGVFTLVIMIVFAGWLLTRRAKDFEKPLMRGG